MDTFDVTAKAKPDYPKLEPITDPEELVRWEAAMDESNMRCYVPREKLEPFFPPEELDAILADDTIRCRNTQYTPNRFPFAIGTFNNSYVWSQVLQQAGWNGEKVVELGPGASRTLDAALALKGFTGDFVKVDYKTWNNDKGTKFKPPFRRSYQETDISAAPEEIPETDLLVMNHFWDDMYKGLWVRDTRMEDYFHDEMTDATKSNQYWFHAIRAMHKIRPEIYSIVDKLASRVKAGGTVVIRNYPSGFETINGQVDRINFTFQLTNEVVERFIKNGFTPMPVNFGEIVGPDGAKYPNSFFVLKKNA